MTYLIADAKRLIIKVGSSLLVNDETGSVHHEWLTSLIQDINHYWQKGAEVIIISSGSVPLGRCQLQLMGNVLQLEQKQACAAVGQIMLAHAYQEVLAEYGITVAQVLLTIEDTENRRRYINARNTLEILLSARVIPVINENDTVATAELRFGDNDRLAARVAQMVSADTLVLLSDIDGLYTTDPRFSSDAQFISEVNVLTPEILAMGGDSATEYGSGGMITKLAAAQIALASGCRMVIAAGKHLHPLARIDETERNTWFIPTTTPISARKNWIAQHLNPAGAIIIDEGAFAALHQGKSLLSVGVIDIEGDFQKGDPVCVLLSNKYEVARGLSNYSAEAARKIMGKRSTEYEAILGYQGCEEVIHRDDLVLKD